MKLQISFDGLDIDQNLHVARQVAEYADIIEIGTLPLFRYGVTIVERFREEFPKKIIFADTKIVDRGRDVVSIFAQAGADWVSVMAGTSREVIHGVCSKAHDLGKKVSMDLLDAGAPGQEALEAKSLGVDALMFHQPYDEDPSLSFLEKWEMVRGNTNIPIFISARIDRASLKQILTIQAHGIVVGKAITESKDPATEAQFFAQVLSSGTI